MKIKLSALILILVFLMTVSVFAAPSTVAVVGSANESDSAIAEDSTANLAAVTSTKPGVNVFTGDLKVETFDGFTQSDVDSMFTISKPQYFELSVAEDATNGTVVKGTLTKDSDEWVNFYNKISTSVNRPAFYYMNYKMDTGSVSAGETAVWVINLVGSKANFDIPATANDQWITASKNNANYIWGNYLHTYNMKWAVGGNVYVDNYALVPWYKITYKNIDENGKSLGNDIETYFIAQDPASVTVSGTDIVGVATTYPVDHTKHLKSSDENYIFNGWSTTQGATTPDADINLNGEDIVLYPVWKNVGGKYVVYEDFESIPDGTVLRKYRDDALDGNGKPIAITNKPYAMNSKGFISSAEIHQGDQAATMTFVELDDGNTVLEVSKVYGYNTAWRMVTFHLKKEDGTGISTAEPGKYVLTLRYYIDSSDLSKYSGISGRIETSKNSFTYIGSGKSVAKGKWHTFTQAFEIKEDGTICYGTNSTAFTPFTRLDFVSSYLENTDNVLFYIDDVKVTYCKSRPVTLNYVDSTGRKIKSVDVTHYDYEGAKLTTPADLGLDYDACYTINGKTYYPNQSAVIDDNLDSVDVVVSNTRVVYFESFNSVNVDTEGNFNITPEYVSPCFAAIGKSPYFSGGDSGAAQKYVSTTESGRNVIAMNRFQTGSKLHSFYFGNLGCLGDGTYTYTIVYKAKGSTLDNAAIDFQSKAKVSFNAPSLSASKLPKDEDGYRTAKFTMTVFTDADGNKKLKYNSSTPLDMQNDSIDRWMFYWWGNNSTDEIIYLDEVAVEFTPYAPGKVNLKSYRNVAPLGMRFASYVDEVQKNKCTEYGFIATRKVFLENAATKAGTGTYTDYLYMENDDVLGTTTTLVTNNDGVMIVGACNYNGVADKIYATDGADFGSSKYLGLNDCVKFFTGVIIGLEGEEQKEETFVVRPYVKVDGVYYYGTPLEASYNDVYNAFNG